VAERNVFLVYMPPNNGEAMVHYEDTIRQRVDLSRIQPHVTAAEARKLESVFGGRRIAVWGSRPGSGNRSKFERMAPGDDLLIVVGDTIKFMGKIALKTHNPALSRELWKNLRGGSSDGWDLIYFIANPVEIDVPFREFSKLFNYDANFRLYGFTAVGPDRLREFYERTTTFTPFVSASRPARRCGCRPMTRTGSGARTTSTSSSPSSRPASICRTRT
jgi:hypothetical protein